MNTETETQPVETQQRALASSNRWHERLRALANLPPVIRMVWEAAPKVVAAGVIIRVISALIPAAMVMVTKWIIDGVEAHTAHGLPLSHNFWWLVALEFGLACLLTVLLRFTDFCDAVMADKFMHHTSLRVMEHASRLDLTSYEDAAFYD